MDIVFYVIALLFIYAVADKTGLIRQQKSQKTAVSTIKISRGVKAQNSKKQQTQLSKIQALDPLFNSEMLSQRVEKAFVAIKDAWSNHNLANVSGFISDGIAQRYAIQFDIQQKHQRHRKILSPKVLDCQLIGVEANKTFETVHFKISSQGRYLVENKAAKRNGNTNSSTNKLPPLLAQVEYWTFTRLAGVKTQQQGGLIEHICPNCGSTLLLNKFAQCQACHSLVTSGEYDWILTKITQQDEWRFLHSHRAIKGVAQYQVIDPCFNISLIEDRVAVIFWRLQQAWLTQQSQPLKAVAKKSYLSHFQQHELKGYFYDHIELALCEVTRVEFNAEADHVHVLVKWTAQQHAINPDAASQKPKKNINQSNNSADKSFAHHMVLTRAHGVLTNSKTGLHSLQCHNCGAPHTQIADDHCSYCQSLFDQGEHNWVLQDFTAHLFQVAHFANKDFIIDKHAADDLAEVFDPVSLLSALILVMLADGEIADKEQQQLNNFVSKHHIPETVLQQALAAARSGQLSMPSPDEVSDAAVWLLEMIEMSLADGETLKEETQLLIDFGHKFNILPVEIDIRMKKIKHQRYSE